MCQLDKENSNNYLFFKIDTLLNYKQISEKFIFRTDLL